MSLLYSILGVPFGYLMWGIYSLFSNYGVSLIIFTVLTRILMFPISFKQQKNMARSRILAPKMKKLREKYANNPQKLQEEQMKLQVEEGINPMASCLPMLLQFLFLFGVLDVVNKPLTHILRFSKDTIESAKQIITSNELAEFSKNDLREELKIMFQVKNDPGLFDSLGNFSEKILSFNNSFLGIDMTKIPEFKPEVWNTSAILLFLIPIIAGVSQLVFSIYSQRLQKKFNPEMPSMGAMKVMLYFMPLISVWFAFKVPAGVGFYWIISTILGMIQTGGLHAYFTPERCENIAAKEKEKAKGKYGGFMQKMLEQSQAANDQPSNRVTYSDEIKNMSRSELNEFNRARIREARKRMAEKYGDEYTDNNED